MQLFAIPHLFKHVPPQSISDSSPSKIPSLHVSASTHTPPEHALEPQSEFTLQLLSLAHFPQFPPQSASDSKPFLTLSLHEGSAHFPLEQIPLAHSELSMHVILAAGGSVILVSKQSGSMPVEQFFSHMLSFRAEQLDGHVVSREAQKSQ